MRIDPSNEPTTTCCPAPSNAIDVALLGIAATGFPSLTFHTVTSALPVTRCEESAANAACVTVLFTASTPAERSVVSNGFPVEISQIVNVSLYEDDASASGVMPLTDSA